MAQGIQCGVNIDPTNDKGRPSIGELRDAGAQWVRFVLKVSDDSLEALDAAFNRDAYRAYISDLAGAGIQILLVLNNETVPGFPMGNMDPNAPEWASFLQRYQAHCKLIAQHYGKQVAAFQVWNEPDFAAPRPDYDPRLPPEVFGRMLKAAQPAIKTVNPQAKVVTAGLVSGNPFWLDRAKAATENKIFADAVSVHPYGQRPENDWPLPNWGFGTLTGLLGEYLKRSQPIPLWISELGTDDVNAQKQFPERAYASLNKNMPGKVQIAFWFCWSDGMVPPFGLRDAGGSNKEAFSSYVKFAKAAGPAGLALAPAADDAPPPGLRRALLKAAARRRVIAPDLRDPLSAAILADNFIPNSAPFGLELDGVHYRGQRADDPKTGRSRLYCAQGPSGAEVTYVEREASK